MIALSVDKKVPTAMGRFTELDILSTLKFLFDLE